MSKVFEREFAGSSGGGSTSAIDTSASGCKLIVVSISYYTSGTPTLSDSAGNTYTALTARSGTDYLVRLYYCISPSLSASHTWTVGGATTYPVMEVAGFDDTVTYEAETGAVNLISNGQPGSITPSANGAILVTACSGGWGSAATINSGFTLLGGVGTTGQQVAGGAAFLIQTTAAAINPTWSGIGVNANNAFAMACFVPAAGGSTATAAAGAATVSAAGASTARTTATAAAGVATVSATGGTLVVLISSTFKNNTGTALASLSNVTAWVNAVESGALVVKLSGRTTNASGICTLQDAAIVTGTQYRVTYRNEATGDWGSELVTAT